MNIETLVIALIGGGIVGFIQFLIHRHDNKNSKMESIIKSIEELRKINKEQDEKNDKRHAVSMRVRILRFRDEMLSGQDHTHDSFRQVLTDIDEYEKYCADHPEFKNNQTVMTIEHIKHNYQIRLEDNDFLDSKMQ